MLRKESEPLTNCGKHFLYFETEFLTFGTEFFGFGTKFLTYGTEFLYSEILCKSLHPFVSSSPAPHLIEEGQPKNAGDEAPRDYFCVTVPDEGGGRRG